MACNSFICAQVSELIKESRQALADSLFSWTCQSPLTKDDTLALIGHLETVTAQADGSLDSVNLALVMALLYCLDASFLEQGTEDREGKKINAFHVFKYAVALRGCLFRTVCFSCGLLLKICSRCCRCWRKGSTCLQCTVAWWTVSHGSSQGCRPHADWPGLCLWGFSLSYLRDAVNHLFLGNVECSIFNLNVFNGGSNLNVILVLLSPGWVHWGRWGSGWPGHSGRCFPVYKRGHTGMRGLRLGGVLYTPPPFTHHGLPGTHAHESEEYDQPTVLKILNLDGNIYCPCGTLYFNKHVAVLGETAS